MLTTDTYVHLYKHITVVKRIIFYLRPHFLITLLRVFVIVVGEVNQPRNCNLHAKKLISTHFYETHTNTHGIAVWNKKSCIHKHIAVGSYIYKCKYVWWSISCNYCTLACGAKLVSRLAEWTTFGTVKWWAWVEPEIFSFPVTKNLTTVIKCLTEISVLLWKQLCVVS